MTDMTSAEFSVHYDLSFSLTEVNVALRLTSVRLSEMSAYLWVNV